MRASWPATRWHCSGCGAATPRPRGAEKLLGYTLMHAGGAIGFMAKSAPGWLVPALALGSLIVWERRWAELRRAELYAGFALQALLIAPWVLSVARAPGGAGALRTLFWNNLAGRFAHIDAPPALDYARGHRNAPGKYFLELPLYLLPWTLIVAAALARAWRQLRAPGGEATALALRARLEPAAARAAVARGDRARYLCGAGAAGPGRARCAVVAGGAARPDAPGCAVPGRDDLAGRAAGRRAPRRARRAGALRGRVPERGTRSRGRHPAARGLRAATRVSRARARRRWPSRSP